MASHRENVLNAMLALIRAALPQANVRRNEVKPQSVGSAGFVNVLDGDPGDPEVSLSPATYVYDHRIGLEVAAGGGPGVLTRPEANLDAMLTALGAAIASNRTLGGLCDYVFADAPTMLPIEATGAVAERQAQVDIVATYGTSDPLN